MLYVASTKSVGTLSIDFQRPIYRYGFQIYTIFVLVYIDASVVASIDNSAPLRVTYNVNYMSM